MDENLSPKRVLESALGETFGDGGGGYYTLKLMPGLSAEELAVRELGLDAPAVPDEIRELLRFAEGFELGGDEIGFWGFGCGGLEAAFPCGNLIGETGEGAGNFWCVDVSRRTGAWGPVFYAAHDPPVVVLQSPTLAGFLRDLVASHRDRTGGPLAALAPFITEVCRRDPDLQNAADLQGSDDPVVRRFVEGLPARLGPWLVADLRGGRVGSGFTWGKFGADTIIRRYGSELLFALAPPPTRRPSGFFSRLFGGR